MAERIRYLLMYDIREPGRLRRVHQVAVDHGERLQYSVYVCDLTRQELVAFRRKLRAEMNAAVDSVSIFDLGPSERRREIRVEHLGKRVLDEPDNEATAEVW